MATKEAFHLDKSWAPLPSATRAVPTKLSYDAHSDRLAYANGKSVFLRSVSHPEEVFQFRGHNFPTSVAKFSPSGQWIASGDESGRVLVWAAPDAKLGPDADQPVVKGDYQVIAGKINDIAWDSESKRVIAVGSGKERFGHCFTFDSGNTVGEISGHSAQISAVSIRPCRPFRAATVGDDGALVFLSSPPYKFLASVRGKHTNFVRDVAFSPCGKHIVSVGSDKKIVVYDGGSGEFVKEIGPSAHDMGIFGVCWLDSTTFATCSTDCSVKVWDLESGSEKCSMALPERSVSNQLLGLTLAGKHLASVSLNGDLWFFDPASGKTIKTIHGHQKSITAMTHVADSLYTASYDGRVVSWDMASGTAKYLSENLHSNLVTDLVHYTSQGESVVVSSGWDHVLGSISGTSVKSKISVEKQPVKLAGDVHGVYGVLDVDGNLTIFDKGKQSASLHLPFESSSLGVSGDYVIVGDDKTFEAKFYDSALKPVSGHALKLKYKPTYFAVSPDGEYLAAGDSSGKIVLYSLKEQKIVTSRWAFHSAKIECIAWKSDSKYVVAGSLDTNLIVYSVEKPVKNYKKMNAHKGGVNVVEWTESGIISGGADGVVSFWNVEL